MNICVKQSSSTDIKNGITWAKALTKESDFFSRTALWMDSSTCSDIIWLDLRMTSGCPFTQFQRSSEGVLDQEEIIQSIRLAQDRFKKDIWALWGRSLQFRPFGWTLSALIYLCMYLCGTKCTQGLSICILKSLQVISLTVDTLEKCSHM